MRFVAVAAAVFIQAQRQIAVGGDALLEDQHMGGAVHRLQRHPLRLTRNHRAIILGIGNLIRDNEHVGAVFAPVAALFPLARIHHLRGFDFLIARRINRPAHIGFERAPHLEAVGMPEDAAVRLFLQVEQVHLAAQLAVVALGGFLQLGEVRIQLLLVEPAGAVNARQLRVLLVAAPVGTCDTHQLEGLRIELAGAGQMRAAAHVEPVAA